jgi:hypothetical protein
MRKTVSHRKLRAALTGFGMVLVLIVVSSPVAASAAAKLFTGGGSGPTSEVAVQAAIWDAETSAGAERLYTCQLVDEPSVFSRLDPLRGPSFSAEATLDCTP